MPVDPPEVGPGKNTPENLPPAMQKRVLWLTLIVGVVALILGGVQLQRNLTKPFRIGALPNLNTNSSNQSIEALRAKDTDKDGLSDYDELYVYHASPYIADSDSDGVSDGQEVKNGTDPNCPENVTGKPCGIVSGNQNSSTANANGSGNTNVDTQTLAAQLRQSLLAAGVTQTELDKVDDATLIQQYQNVIAEQGTNTNATANSNTASTNIDVNSISSPDQLSSLTAAQIRQLLLANGIPQSTLDSYDDATISAIYLNALQNAANNANTNA